MTATLLVQDLPVKNATFFQTEVAEASIPASVASSYSSIRVIVRNLYVDLKDVYTKIAEDKLTSSQVSVYADTLKVSKLDTAIKVPAGLTLFARQLVVEEGAIFELDYQTSQKPSLVIYTRHVQGSLKANVLTIENSQPTTQEINLSEKFAQVPAPNGIKIYYRYDTVTGTGSAKTAIFHDFSGINLALVTPSRMVLRTTFQLCTVIGHRERELATDMLFWIMDVGNSSMEGAELNVQSAAVLAELNVKNDSSSVPNLSVNFYTTQFANLVDLVETYETQYNRFTDLKNSLDDRKAAATLLLEKEVDSSDYYQILVDQASNNFTNAQIGLYRANAALSAQNTTVESAGIDLNVAMEIWLKEQKIRLALDLISTVLSFAVAVGMATVGGPVGTGNLTKSMADAGRQGVAVEAAYKAHKTSDKKEIDNILGGLNLSPTELQKLKDQTVELYEAYKVQKNIKMLYDIQVGAAKLKLMMDNVKNVIDVLTNLIANTQALVKAAKTLGRVPQPIKLPDEPGADGGTAGQVDLSAFQDALTDWDIFQVTVEGMLQPMEEEAAGENGSKAFLAAAVKYKTELNKLTIYGKAVVTSQIAVVQFGRETANLMLQKLISGNQQARLESYIAQLSQDAAKDEELIQLLFERQLGIKRWLYLSLRNYQRAYRYWALQDSSIEFSITQPAAEFERNKTQMDTDFQNALQRFKPRVPQTLNRAEVIIPAVGEGPYKDVIKNLIETGETRFRIYLDEEKFAGFERVRLDRVRVWLEGVTASHQIPVRLSITNVGSFGDRLTVSVNQDGQEIEKLQLFTFSGPILERTFAYQGVIGDANQIIVDGDVAEDMKVFYSQPTPFTEWIVKTPSDRKFDVSNLTAFRLEFAGTVIGKLGMMADLN
jgi:hypothetical protein